MFGLDNPVVLGGEVEIFVHAYVYVLFTGHETVIPGPTVGFVPLFNWALAIAGVVLVPLIIRVGVDVYPIAPFTVIELIFPLGQLTPLTTHDVYVPPPPTKVQVGCGLTAFQGGILYPVPPLVILTSIVFQKLLGVGPYAVEATRFI